MKMSDANRSRATNHRRIIPGAPVGLALAALALSTMATLTTAAGAAAATGGKVVVSTMPIGTFGKVLVSSGKALYTLAPSASGCDAQCLQIWPAVTLPTQVKMATAGPGVSRSALGITRGVGGSRQVTYHGHAVYWYSGDTRGHVDGNFTDAWGKWTVVVVGHTSAKGSSSSTSSGTTAGSGGTSF